MSGCVVRDAPGHSRAAEYDASKHGRGLIEVKWSSAMRISCPGENKKGCCILNIRQYIR